MLSRPLPLRWHHVAQSVGALLPVLGFAAVLLHLLATEQRGLAERRLVNRARALAAALDADMESSIRTLSALAASERLDGEVNLPAFHAEAKRVHSSQPTWRAVALLSRDGHQVLNTLRPADARLRPAVELASVRTSIETRRPAVGDLAHSADGVWAFAIRVPVVRGGRVQHVLTAVSDHRAVLELLQAREVDEQDWTRTVVDRQGRVVARTRDADGRFIGSPATLDFLERSGKAASGWFRSTTLDGAAAHVSYARAAVSGWTVAVIVPVEVIDGPVRRSWQMVGAIGLAVVLVSALAASLVARRVSGAIEAATAAADALARGRRPDAPPSSVLEVEQLRRALLRTSDLLLEHEAERDRHLSTAERARRDAEAANRAKDEFLAMLGHELRNPLAPIQNSIHVLQRAAPDGEPAARARDVLARQTAHLCRLVDDLLDVGRIARGRVELRADDVDLGRIVRLAAEDHQGVLHGRGIELELRLPPEPLPVHGDEARLAQAIGNVLHNAAKFTARGGRVTITGRRAAEHVEVAVSDTGSGIDPALLATIFEPFTQARQTLARSEGGLGLGLAVVKGLVELHGGTVSAASDGPGRGSTFTLRLPLASRSAPGRSNQADSPTKAIP